jgi:hypothetical protein
MVLPIIRGDVAGNPALLHLGLLAESHDSVNHFGRQDNFDAGIVINGHSTVLSRGNRIR